MQKILLCIFCSLIVLNYSCSKKDDGPDEYLSVFYNQTSCSDPWGYSNDKDELANKVQEFFTTENIEIYDVKFDNKGTAQLCNACTCLSGIRIITKIKRDDLDNMIDHGFREFMD